MKLLLCAVLVALVGIVTCRGLPSEEYRSGLLESVKSYLTGKGFISPRKNDHKYFRRQETSNCTLQSQCLPSHFSHVPSNLIHCSDRHCVCNECFELSSDGICKEVPCKDWKYNQAEFKCDDDRPSQKTALYLSIFLLPLGAANFYIGRDDLGGGQLFLLLILVIAGVTLCISACQKGKHDDFCSYIIISLTLLIIIPIVLIDVFCGGCQMPSSLLATREILAMVACSKRTSELYIYTFVPKAFRIVYTRICVHGNVYL